MSQVMSHGGDSGDVVYALPTIKHLGGGKLYLMPNSITREPFTPEKVERWKPFLESQDCIESVEFSNTPKGINLDNWRNYTQPASVADTHAIVFGAPYPVKPGWLKCNNPSKIAETVFARGTRYLASDEMWHAALRDNKHAVFIGLKYEYDKFVEQFGYIPWYDAPTPLDLFRVIAGSKKFYGSASLPACMAIGLNIPHIDVEYHPGSYFDVSNIRYWNNYTPHRERDKSYATLSIVLPAFNEEIYLPRQLEAIAKQSRPPDQLTLIDDGSTDATGDIMQQYRHNFSYRTRCNIIRNEKPSGIIQAYNQAVSLASEDWVLTLSANDELQPGAISAWEDGVKRYPNAMIMAGHEATNKLRWPAGYIAKNRLLICLRKNHIPGEATFFRKSIWTPYHTDLGGISDMFFNHVMAIRHGLVYLGKPISKFNRQKTSGHPDGRNNALLLQIMKRVIALLPSDVKRDYLNTGILEGSIRGRITRAELGL